MGSKKLFFAAVLLCASAFAQNALVPVPPVFLGPAQSPRLGANLTVSFCTSVATLNNCLAGSAYAQAFADSSNSFPINQVTNPLKTDALGNAPSFFAAPGLYSFAVSGPSIAAPQGPYLITVSCIPGVTCVALGSNNTWTGTNTFNGIPSAGPIGGTTPSTGAFTSGSFNTTLTTQQINGDLWLGSGPGQYASMSACYTALTAGQACHVPAGWSETFAANLVMSKAHSGFIFHGNATISMSTFSITKASGIPGFIKGIATSTDFVGTRFNYAGSGIAFDIGDTNGTTISDDFENFDIDIQGATNNSAVSAMRFRRVQGSIFQSINVIGATSTSNQIGIVCDGTASVGQSYTGDNSWINIHMFQIGTGIQALTNCNFNTITGAAIFPHNIGVDFQAGNGNVVVADIEVAGTTAINFANSNNVFGNRVFVYGQANTADCTFGASATGNICDNIGATSVNPIIVSGSLGTFNNVVNPYKASIRLGTIPASCAVTGAGASATCNVTAGLSADSSGVIRINSAGAGPAATGTITLTLSSSFTNLTECQFSPSNGSTAWNARATIFQSNYAPGAPVGAWDNNAVALVAGNSYDVVYFCVGH